jgi:serine protease Do
VALLGIVAWWAIPSPARAQDPPPKPSQQEALKYANALSQAFENAADAIRPSVVTIRAVRHFKPAAHGGNTPLPDFPNLLPLEGDMLRRFFSGRMPGMSVPPQQGLGSGVIVNGDGYILTNNHVVGNADEVEVTMPDGREHRATVIGTDPMTDLAVVRIKASDLKAATLGDSDKLKVGEWIIAAGNPFGLNDTITAGIVSAKGRSNMRIAEYEDFIQTDAAINPGNSGGPLVNLRGEVVGINTAIASRTGAGNGVGFAIPINMAKSIMESLIRHGQVVRGWLGLSIQPLNEDLAKSFGYDSTKGALVGDVLANGPAEHAGLKRGDIVTRFSGTRIKDAGQFRTLVAETEPGSKAKIEVFRDGKTRTVTVAIGKRDQGTTVVRNDEKQDAVNGLGMNVTNATSEALRDLGMSEDLRGVLITGVDQGGAAARAGLQPGDLILDVQGALVTNVKEFRRQIDRHDLKNGIRLLVQSGETRHFVLLRNED